MNYIYKKFAKLKNEINDVISFSLSFDEMFRDKDQLTKDIMEDLRQFDRVSINLEKKEKAAIESKKVRKLYIVK